MEAISDAADISPRTFFNDIHSRYAVFRNPEPPWTTGQFDAAIAARPTDEHPLEVLRAVVAAFAVLL